MNTNSFIIKGWAITLTSAVFALANEDAKSHLITILCATISLFWLLDGFYLSQERKYRKLYDNIRLKDEREIDFNMSTIHFEDSDTSWLSGVFSKTIFPTYGISIIIACIAYFLIR